MFTIITQMHKKKHTHGLEWPVGVVTKTVLFWPPGLPRPKKYSQHVAKNTNISQNTIQKTHALSGVTFCQPGVEFHALGRKNKNCVYVR